MRPSSDKDTKYSHNWENNKILWLMYTHKDPVSKHIFLVVTELHVSLFVHRDQVYLVSLRESYRNEIIPYRVRFSPQAALAIHKYWKGFIENTEPFITEWTGGKMREWKKCVPACYVARMCLIPHDVLFFFFFFLQKLTWRSGQADREMCAVKGKHRVSRGKNH